MRARGAQLKTEKMKVAIYIYIASGQSFELDGMMVRSLANYSGSEIRRAGNFSYIILVGVKITSLVRHAV